MKRSPALAPLSRDHHVALVVARQLMRAGEADAAAAVERFVRFLAGHELAHFALEESLLLPTIPDGPRGRALAERTLEDHDYLRSAAERLKGRPAPVDVGYLHELGGRLRAHVQMEESELFPYLESELDAAALEELGARLSGAERDPEPPEVVRAFLDAFTSRNIDALLTLADPSIEMRPPRHMGAAAYRGHDGVRRWVDDVDRRAGAVSFHLRDVRGLGDQRALARVQLLLAEEKLATVSATFTVKAGRVAEVRGYFSDEELMAEVGHI